MKFLFFTLIFTFSTISYSFTLTAAGKAYKYNDSEVTINVSDGDCNQRGITNATLISLVKDSIDMWNRVETSEIFLKFGASVALNDANTISAIRDASADNTITVFCSTNTADFTSQGPAGLGGMTAAATGAKGAAAINNTSSATTMTYGQNLGVIAHEIGHALGLGHSNLEHALMAYAVFSTSRSDLAEDDKDGISFLYPNDAYLLGIFGSCGSLKTIKSNLSLFKNSKKSFTIYFFFLLLPLFALLIYRKRIIRI